MPRPSPPLIRRLFANDDDRVWLNTAHQGVLPVTAADELLRALSWKRRPAALRSEVFTETVQRTRSAIAAFIGAPAAEVALANSASYGLHLLANGLDLGEGDEVVVAAGSFPSTVLPWLGLRERGVDVRRVRAVPGQPLSDVIGRALTERTRVVALDWVESFSGRTNDLAPLGEMCRGNGTVLVVNASQAIGARPATPALEAASALVSVGWKWMCGPYGTGFVWLHRDTLARLRVNQRYWLNVFSEADLAGALDLEAPPPADARRYDVFATANFFNFLPWVAAVELLRSVGAEACAAHAQTLVARLHDRLDRDRFEITSPSELPERSALVFIRPRGDLDASAAARRLGDEGIDVAHRAGQLRVSPHVHNTEDDIDRLVESLGGLD